MENAPAAVYQPLGVTRGSVLLSVTFKHAPSADSESPEAASERSDDAEPPGAESKAKPGSRSGSPKTASFKTDSKTGSKASSSKPSGSITSGSLETCQIRLRLLTDDTDPPVTGWLKPQFTRIAALAKVTRAQVTLVIVGDAEMAKLHEQFTGVKGTTDVLTFDHRDDQRQPIEADLVLCLDTAKREAKARGHDARLEMLLYAVHGLNHLLGGDDHTPKGARAMHQWEDRLLVAAGFGPVFNKPGKDPGTGRKTVTLKPRSGHKKTKHAKAIQAKSSRRQAGTKPHSKTSSTSSSKPKGKSQGKASKPARPPA